MKKNVIIIVLILALLGNIFLVFKFKDKPVEIRTEKVTEVKKYREIIHAQPWDAILIKYDIYTKQNNAWYEQINEKIDAAKLLQEEFEKGETIKPIDNIPLFLVPPDIHPSQIYDDRREYGTITFFEVGDLYLALARNCDMNYSPYHCQIGQRDKYKFRGILAARKDNLKWHKFAEFDSPANNPLFLWNEGTDLLVSMMGWSGAGSGEGYLKIIYSEDAGNQWSINSCYEHAIGQPGGFTGSLDQLQPIHKKEYNEKLNRFEGFHYYHNGSWKHYDELEVYPSCKNIDLPVRLKFSEF